MSGIIYLIDDLNGENQRDDLREERRIKNEWINADSDGNDKLDINEIANLLHKLNIEIDSSAMKKMFAEFDADNSGLIDYNEFTALIRKIDFKAELEPTFVKYSMTNPSSN